MPTAFDLNFPTWPPTSEPPRHAHHAPVGAIGVRKVDRRSQRYIKIRLDGRPRDRWMTLSRFWWLKFKGEVPAGKIVGYLDGDSMNDAPSNYVLYTPGEQLAILHEEDTTWSARQHARAGVETARHNRLRGEINRATRWLRDRWYAVDFEARRVINVPMRKRVHVYRAYGFAAQMTRNGHGFESSLFGWPGLRAISAVMLSLLDAGPMDRAVLWEATQRIARRYDFVTPMVDSLALRTPLFKAGLIRSARRGPHPTRYFLTEKARSQRGPVCPIVAVHGPRLEGDEFRFFERFNPDLVEAA